MQAFTDAAFPMHRTAFFCLAALLRSRQMPQVGPCAPHTRPLPAARAAMPQTLVWAYASSVTSSMAIFSRPSRNSLKLMWPLPSQSSCANREAATWWLSLPAGQGRGSEDGCVRQNCTFTEMKDLFPGMDADTSVDQTWQWPNRKAPPPSGSRCLWSLP